MPFAYTHAERWNRARIGETVTFAYTSLSARNAADLGFGFYRISCTTDAFIRQGDNTVSATTSDYPLFIGQEAFMMVDQGITLTTGQVVNNDATTGVRLAAIRSSANGTCFITQIDEL